MHNPLVQFIPQSIGFGLHAAQLSCAVITCVFLLMSVTSFSETPGRIQIIIENSYQYVEGSLTSASIKYTPLMFSIQSYILIANLLGLCPLFFTVTSHLSVTLFFAALVFILSFFAGFILNTRHFVEHFFIPEIPIVMRIPVGLLEILLYLIKPLTLGVRLAINMTVGHVLTHVIADLGVNFGIAAVVAAIFVLLFLTAIELLVCFVQTLVFGLLGSEIVNDSTNSHSH